MSKASSANLTRAESNPTPSFAILPGELPPCDSKSAKAAIRRCIAAWHRAYQAFVELSDPNDQDALTWARVPAGKAYCQAMPIISSRESLCEFVACATHGILINAIPPEKRNNILYAAQLALSLFQAEPKPSKSSPA
jgi:hypothetical protein